MNVAVLGGRQRRLHDRGRPGAGRSPRAALAPVGERPGAAARRRRHHAGGRGAQGARRGSTAPPPISAEALDGAEVVIVPLPATSHDDLAKRLAGARSPASEIVLLTPGTLGTLRAGARDLARAGAHAAVRLRRDAARCRTSRARRARPTVSAPVRAANLPVGVFPASRSKAALERISALVPGHPAVRRRARRRADQRRAGHPSAAGAGERGLDRRRARSTSTRPAPRPARGG